MDLDERRRAQVRTGSVAPSFEKQLPGKWLHNPFGEVQQRFRVGLRTIALVFLHVLGTDQMTWAEVKQTSGHITPSLTRYVEVRWIPSWAMQADQGLSYTLLLF